MAWNWVELQQVLVDSPCMRLVLSGHDHMGGYAQHGRVHFVTVEAMLEGELVHVFLLTARACVSSPARPNDLPCNSV